MRKKTKSLTFPEDALAAMRELQELNFQDNNMSIVLRPDESNSTTITRRYDSTFIHAPVQQNKTPNEIITNSEQPVPQPEPPAQSTGNRDSEDFWNLIKHRIERNPVTFTANYDSVLEEAMKQSLIAPYNSPPANGPFTVTSIKMPEEVWRRIGLAANLTGVAKQELVAEALEIYLLILVAKLNAKPDE